MSYTPVQNRFWSDGWVRLLNPLDRYLVLYLLTNGRARLTGVYELPVDLMAAECGIDQKDLQISMLPRLEPKIYYREGWVIITNYLKHRVSDSPKYLQGILNEFNALPLHIKEIAKSYGYPIDTLPIPNRNRIDKNRIEKEDFVPQSSSFSGKDSRSQEDVTLSDVDDWGLPIRSRTSKTPAIRPNSTAVSLLKQFVTLGKERTGTTPLPGKAGLVRISYALNTAKLSQSQVKSLFEDWFDQRKPDEQLISITACLSNRAIEQYKIRNGIV